MKQYDVFCDNCKWSYRVIDPKTRKVVGCICYLWYEGEVGQYDHYLSLDHEHCFTQK